MQLQTGLDFKVFLRLILAPSIRPWASRLNLDRADRPARPREADPSINRRLH